VNGNENDSPPGDGPAHGVVHELESLKSEVNAVEGEVESLKGELAEQRERYLRLAADFENFRKRTAQETTRRAAAQKESIIQELLPILDNLERAVASGASSPRQLREGVKLTLQQFNQLLQRHGIEREESLGQPFDPHRHEAVAIRQDQSRPDHVVLETFQPGYRRGQEVFRPAKVVVNELQAENG